MSQEVQLAPPTNEIIDQLISALTNQYNETDKWVDEHGNNCKQYNLQNQPNSQQRIYYNYGRLSMLEEILKLLAP